MIQLMNLNNKNLLEYEISYKDKKVIFNIGKLVNKRDKTELDPKVQTKLINSYIEYKGEEFKSTLFEKYVKAERVIMESILYPGIYPLPSDVIVDIIDMFDLMDIFHYIKNVVKLQAPSNLKPEFDTAITDAGHGTRVQTYIIDDYFELAATSVALKAVLGPIGHFAFVKDTEINGIHKEDILYSMLDATRVADSSAMEKVKGLAEKIIDITMRDKSVSAVTVIDKQIPRAAFSKYIVSIIALQKIAVANIIMDNRDENVITKMYNYIINKLRVKGSTSGKIYDKKPLRDESTQQDESIVEAYRVTSSLPLGFEVELDWAVSDINQLISSINVDLDPKNINIGVMAGMKVTESTITKEQMQLLGSIYKGVIDPRGLEYLSSSSLVNLLAVGYAYLVAIGFEDISTILTSVAIINTEDTISINSNVNKARISNELKEELNVIFPYRRVVNKLKSVNIAEETINELANALFTRKWVNTLDGNSGIIGSDIKIRLTEFIIKNESVIYDSK